VSVYPPVCHARTHFKMLKLSSYRAVGTRIWA